MGSYLAPVASGLCSCYRRCSCSCYRQCYGRTSLSHLATTIRVSTVVDPAIARRAYLHRAARAIAIAGRGRNLLWPNCVVRLLPMPLPRPELRRPAASHAASHWHWQRRGCSGMHEFLCHAGCTFCFFVTGPHLCPFLRQPCQSKASKLRPDASSIW